MPGRRYVLVTTFLLAVALAAGTAAGNPVLEDPALETRVETLENGLTVLLLEERTTPVVSFQMWVRVGSRDETRYTGLAHLFEHMMFKGSTNVAPEEHARLVQARGGVLNAYTTRDFTVYYENVPSEALALVIDLEGERVANLDISEETLSSERDVVLEERRLRTEDRPSGLAREALYVQAFRAHPYRWPVIGWRSDVEAIRVEVCRDFFNTYYAPNNIVIAVVGDFDADEAMTRIERAFGSLAPAEIPRSPTREPEQRGERRETLTFDLRSPVLVAAWHAPAAGHPDAEALDVASLVLSAGRSSRLYRRLVYEEQQALSAHGGYLEMLDAGIFSASVSVRPDGDIDRAESLLMAEIARLRDEPVPEEDLEKAKRQLEVSLVMGLSTNEALASRIAIDTVIYGHIRPLSERIEAIHAVTAEDVQRVARAYLTDQRRSVVRVIAPPEEEAP